MCGRFALHTSAKEIEALFDVDGVEPFPSRYNIAPTQPILTVIEGSAPQGRQRTALLVRWGLVPAWAKDPRDLPLLFNARSETAAGKASFRAAMRHRRALVPASGFYEWRRDGKRKSQAYWVRPKEGGIVAFAGLVETWHEPGGSEIDTGAILTTAANAELAVIHERMPVVIRPRDFSRWLDCLNNEPHHVSDLLRPAQPGFFEAVPVSDRVNAVANATPDLLEPVPEGSDVEPAGSSGQAPAQLDLF